MPTQCRFSAKAFAPKDSQGIWDVLGAEYRNAEGISTWDKELTENLANLEVKTKNIRKCTPGLARWWEVSIARCISLIAREFTYSFLDGIFHHFLDSVKKCFLMITLFSQTKPGVSERFFGQTPWKSSRCCQNLLQVWRYPSRVATPVKFSIS